MDEINELRQKMKFLERHDVPRRIAGMGDRKGLQPLCERIGVERETLRDQKQKGVLSSTMQGALARGFDFGLDWSTWKETDFRKLQSGAERRDGAAAFIEQYLQKHQTVKLLDVVRRTGGRLRSTRPEKAWHFDGHLASLDLFAMQGPGEARRFTVGVVCRWAPVEGIEIAVKRGRVTIDCGEAQTTDIKEREDRAKQIEATGDAGKISVSVAGSIQQPSWEFSAAAGPIGVLRLPDDFYFCEIADLAPGDVISAHFSVYFKDLEAGEAAQDRSEEDPLDHGTISLLRRGNKPFGKAQERILKRLAELKLPNGENGWAELCRDAVHFVAADETIKE